MCPRPIHCCCSTLYPPPLLEMRMLTKCLEGLSLCSDHPVARPAELWTQPSQGRSKSHSIRGRMQDPAQQGVDSGQQERIKHFKWWSEAPAHREGCQGPAAPLLEALQVGLYHEMHLAQLHLLRWGQLQRLLHPTPAAQEPIVYVCWEIWKFCVRVWIRVSKSARNSCTCCTGDIFRAFCAPCPQVRVYMLVLGVAIKLNAGSCSLSRTAAACRIRLDETP